MSAENAFPPGHPEETPNPLYKRWYDQDPALARAIDQLRVAPDKYQAQIALNIIKIIIEHQIEAEMAADQLTSDLQETSTPFSNGFDPADIKRWLNTTQSHHNNGKRRWYDVHETLHSAMQLLHDCPDDLQPKVIPTIAVMIEDTLRVSSD